MPEGSGPRRAVDDRSDGESERATGAESSKVDGPEECPGIPGNRIGRRREGAARGVRRRRAAEYAQEAAGLRCKKRGGKETSGWAFEAGKKYRSRISWGE
jgi:hypothetical protein